MGAVTSACSSPATDITVEESELGNTSDSITAFQSSALSILSKLWHLVQQRSCRSAKYKGAVLLSPHTLLELKVCFNPVVVIPVAVLNEIIIQMQVTTGCKGIVDYRWQLFGCKLSSVCDVVVQEWNVHTDVAYSTLAR